MAAKKGFFRSKITLLFAIATVISFIGFSCQEDPSSLGLDLLPPKDKVSLEFIDTLSILSSTQIMGDLVTSQVSYAMVGSYIDPVFGATKASFLSDWIYKTQNMQYGLNAVADSITLTLAYKNVYGDSLAMQEFIVYELIDTLIWDSAYYATTDPQPYYNSNNYLAKKFTSLQDTVLTFKLDKSLANKLIAADSLAKIKPAEFRKIFKGIYITTPSTQSAAVAQINLFSANTKIRLYYHNSKDTTYSDFIYTQTSIRVNIFEHNYDNAEFYSSLNNPPSISNKMYVQGMGGVITKLMIQNLEALKGKYLVNRAELVLPLDKNSNSTISPLKYLLLQTKTDKGSFQYLPEYNLNVDKYGEYFDGSFNEDSSEYKMYITRYIQKFLTEPNVKNELYLLSTNPSLIGEASVLKGSGQENGIKLRLLLSKF